MRRLAILLLVAVSSMAQDTPSAQTFSISGVVKSGNSLIPGATVNVSNAVTGAKPQHPQTSMELMRSRSLLRGNTKSGLKCPPLRPESGKSFWKARLAARTLS